MVQLKLISHEHRDFIGNGVTAVELSHFQDAKQERDLDQTNFIN